MSTVPSYLALSDLGLGTVAGNDMALSISVGDRRRAVEIFQSSWSLIFILSIIILILALGATFEFPITRVFHIHVASGTELRVSLVCLCIYSVISLQVSLLVSAFRSAGKYALGVTTANLIRLAEGTLAIVLAASRLPPHVVALGYLLVRIAGTSWMYCLLLQKVPWIDVGFRKASYGGVKHLVRPAFAFMAFPAGNALSIQGMTLLINLELGAPAVALFASMRTLTRFAFQITDTIKNATWPELSSAFGAQNWPLARKLHRTACMIALWLSSSAVIFLAFCGPTIFKLWTRGRLLIDAPTYGALLLIVVASSLWNTSSAVPIAANLHSGLALRYLTGTVGALCAAYFLLPRFDLFGAGLGLLLSDLWMSSFVVGQSNKLLGDDMVNFAASMINPTKLLTSVRS